MSPTVPSRKPASGAAAYSASRPVSATKLSEARVGSPATPSNPRSSAVMSDSLDSPSTPTPAKRLGSSSKASQAIAPISSGLTRERNQKDTATDAETEADLADADSNTISTSPSASVSARSVASSSRPRPIELSLPTRRRLIRKPLPSLPGAGDEDGKDGLSGSSGNKNGAVIPSLPGVRALEWTPSSLPEHEMQDEGAKELHSRHDQHDTGRGPGLDAQSAEHLDLFVSHFISGSQPHSGPSASPEPKTATLKASTSRSEASETLSSGTVKEFPSTGTGAGDELDAEMGLAMAKAVKEACVTLSAPDTLEALQRTAAMKWRAEASLRNSLSQEGNIQAQASSRWARLGWAGLIGVGAGNVNTTGMTSTRVTSNSSAYNPSSITSEALNEQFLASLRLGGDEASGSDGEARLRKRDVAVRMLANAAWLVRMYAAGPAIQSETGLPTNSLDSVATQSTPGVGISSTKDTAKKAGGPALLRGPTVAAAKTTVSLNTGSSLEGLDKAHESFPPATDPSESTNVVAEGSLLQPPSRPSSTAPASTSKAREHLASLSAAAGAAMAAAAREADATATSRIPSKAASRRPSITSLSSQISTSSRASAAAAEREEAARIETEAIEKANKAWLKQVGTKCDQAARACVAQIGVRIQVVPKNVRRRTGTITASKTLGFPSLWPLSASSDPDKTEENLQLVEWQPNRFDGEHLLGTPSYSLSLSKTAVDPHLTRVGGTFVLSVEDEAEGSVARRALEVLVYVGLCMLLESAFLTAIGAPRPQPEPTRTDADTQDSSGKVVQRARAQSDAAVALKEEAPTSPEASETTSNNKTPRRWGRGLWGVGGAVSAALRAPISGRASIDETPTRHVRKASSGKFERSSTMDVQVSESAPGARRASITSESVGLPRSKTKDERRISGSQASRATRASLDLANPFRAGRLGRIISSSLSRQSNLSDEAEQAGAEVAKGEGTTSLDPTRPQISSVPDKESTLKARGDARSLVALAPAPLSASPEVAALWAREKRDRSMGDQSFVEAFHSAQRLAFLVEGNAVLLAFAAGDGATDAVDEEDVEELKDPSAPTPNPPLSVPTPNSARNVSGASLPPTPSTAASASAKDVKSIPGQDVIVARGEVRFYARAGRSKDVPLGQLIEEMCAKVNEEEAKVLHSAASNKAAAVESAPQVASQAIHYIHGDHRISVVASLLPSALISTQHKGIDHAQGDSSEDQDVAVVAAALHTNNDAARAAVAAAESAVLCAEMKGNLIDAQGLSIVAEKNKLWMWNVETGTGEQSKATLVPKGVYLMSFAKYLEALLYHPALKKSTAHDADAGDGYDLVRAFRMGRALVKVCTQPVALYDLAIEGPRIYSSAHTRGQDSKVSPSKQSAAIVKQTRLEIQHFFSSVKARISQLETIFVARELDEMGKTIKPASVSKSFTGVSMDSESLSERSINEELAGPLQLLASLGETFTNREFELYDALKETDPNVINDIRKAFNDRAKSAKNRLAAWTTKHLTKTELKQLGPLDFELPEYAKPGVHSFPGSKHLIREDEPLSIVAFSLSSRDYKGEMGAAVPQQPAPEHNQRVLNWRTSVIPGGGSQLSSNSGVPSVAGSTSTDASRRSAGSSALDPDVDEDFHQAEPVRVHMKRKRRGREASILSLTLRRVGSSISAHSESQATTPTAEHVPVLDQASGIDKDVRTDPLEDDADASFSGLSLDVDLATPGVSPLSPHAFDKVQSTPPTSRMRKGANPRAYDGSIASSSSVGGNSTFRAHVTQLSVRPNSLASIFSRDTAELTELAGNDPDISSTSLGSSWGMGSLRAGKQETSAAGATGSRISSHSLAPPTPSTEVPPELSTSLATSADEDALSATPRSTSHTHNQAESPHVKHNLFHGNTKVSCVSWFAQDFATLRRKWGIVDNDFAESLARCASWNASGGKSKSAFFKTKDERFVAKQLLTVWSVDEKEAFLEFAPAYLRYMMNAAVNDCPTLLVKIAGVYSLKVKQIGGETRLKMNIMVLENLWTGKEVSAAFCGWQLIRNF
ncbi:hypothetical protein IE81DRAFT_325689 [Ceraceosorus guamensis]|uniref:PIPK domain-containing protein n=1 Tax=Ceraceosorus guamensis TaxID=1522189 RepID=A0A316VXY2_9BASI|nr:hypothetical protein IE81DRAFT_325689 [Ceraceosorus guamensis]PWN40335.1 hypothetical protein IE81DRAFT_325689 [Ceraceosorus guamensis]